ncbi:metallo-beta-lactamase family protein [Caloramator fervidus]|uniref:Metallo-beta-lactamase family protein n=1 Tax=Caloramator fervidus TaxID=29344 RepID=A0A1H5SBX2_9CLOT|nr:MBL fold metallo-hydrolase [Caloramator fervidus]SEF47311.1 metallo-beta-lactamase family protein [Caloramator fervidus]
MIKVKFCGAAKSVTGSCYLIETSKRKFLVDCGLFQGKDSKKNQDRFPFDPKEIDFVIISHAHIDHSGRLPLLIREGFKGSIYCTIATADLLKIMLIDSAHIQEMDTLHENKKRQRKGLPLIQPLYTVEDAEKVNDYLFTIPYNFKQKIDDTIYINFKDAGHLLGSAIVEIYIEDNGKINKLVFSGDLGNINIPIIRDYEYVDYADYLIIESTYGNRFHSISSETQDLCSIILNTTNKGGNVIIPSFAVGRTQEILYMLNKYIDIEKRRQLSNIEIFLDSPLAEEATEVFKKHIECYDEEALRMLTMDKDILNFKNLKFTKTKEESMELNNKNGVVIISSSGMCEAGRIRHHLKYNLWRKDSTIVFVGYQAEGTLGRRILDGSKKVKIFGEEIAVNAKIVNMPGLSGHADLQGLINWFKNIKGGVKKQIFITHGEIDASLNFKNIIENFTSTKCIIPNYLEEYIL